jgi:integrase
MARVAPTLSAKAIAGLKKTGFHAVGGVSGLYIQITKSKSSQTILYRSWVLRYSIGGTRKNMGLGAYEKVSLTAARNAAREAHALIAQGIDPVIEKKAAQIAATVSKAKQKTFEECAESYMATHLKTHRSVKHQKQWSSTLKKYAYPIIGKIIVGDITTAEIVSVLEQKTSKRGEGVATGIFWEIKTETATRVRERIESILNYATVAGFFSGANPARWKGHLDALLPAPHKIRNIKHHDAMPYAEAATFLEKLRIKSAMGAKALEFLILTGVRSRSVRLAEWVEIDWKNKIWVIPAGHTKKGKREHRVPLVAQTIRILKSLPVIAGRETIFTSSKGSFISDSTLSKIMRDMREKGEFDSIGVPHGFRSCFRDWAAEQTNYPEELRKVATMHTVGDAVQQAYQRTDLLEKRRRLMRDWANYLDTTSPSSTQNILKFGKTK